jgi:hypothetical protein
MPYASRDELAAALRIRVTAANTQLLEDCLDAAADEIDAALDRVEPLPAPPPAAVRRTNVNRAAEWYKAADMAGGVAGTDQTGTLTAPASGFGPHKAAILADKQQWGVG